MNTKMLYTNQNQFGILIIIIFLNNNFRIIDITAYSLRK